MFLVHAIQSTHDQDIYIYPPNLYQELCILQLHVSFFIFFVFFWLHFYTYLQLYKPLLAEDILLDVNFNFPPATSV